MSYLISGLNIKNIFEYNSAQTYQKYDIIDYQLNSGISVYPDYTGLGVTGLSYWFNNDYIKDFEVDGDNNISGWLNKQGDKNLTQIENEPQRPYIDFDVNYIDFRGEKNLTGTGFALDQKTIFLCLNSSKPAADDVPQNILQISNPDDINDFGYLRLSGQNFRGSSKICIDDVKLNSVSPIYDATNILTLIQTTGIRLFSTGPYVDIEVRQNGYSIGNFYDVNSGWLSGFLKIGENQNESEGFRLHELFCFSGALNSTQIDYYEKYLFEKYFINNNFYYATQSVPANNFYAPITYTGKSYWTQDINDLFRLSYGCSANFSAKLSTLNFGDGYKSVLCRNINSLNASFDLKYEGLTDRQAKALITFFENSPEAQAKSDYEGFKAVNLDLFSPFKTGAQVYFLDIDHATPYNDINNIYIKGESLYESVLDYKGMFVKLDEVNIRTYSNELLGFEKNDVVYFESSSFKSRGYYFYTGEPSSSNLSEEYSPTGASSLFTKNFYFKPDIDYGVKSSLRLITQDYKGSTKQFLKDGINYNILELDLVFSKRTNKEAVAILKFLDDKAGFKTFRYTLPNPYNKSIDVYCPEWNYTYNFYDNNDISVKFIEYRGLAEIETIFDTVVTFVDFT